jgi:hypothetical protein
VSDALSVPWHAPHKVIYIAHSRLPELSSRGWEGGVWVAKRGWSPDIKMVYPGLNIVAVQYEFDYAWDKSVIYDPTWVYSFSVTPHPSGTSFGWGFVPQAAWQLVVRGRISVINERVTSNHLTLRLAPGEYTAQVRIANSPLWSEVRSFTVGGK